MTKYDVVVTGAGMGGLSAAITLGSAGYKVLVIDRLSKPGGKMRQVFVDNLPIDSGPTVFTMRWVFDSLLDRANTSLEEHLTLKKAEVLARHAWDDEEDNPPLDLYADVARTEEAIGDFAGAREAKGYRSFCEEACNIFKTLKEPFMASQRPNLFQLPLRVGLTRLHNLFMTRPFDTMWNALGQHFSDPRLRQLFGRYATYCGSSPFEAAATLMLVAHVEQDGVWMVKGGMYKLACAMEDVAKSVGTDFSYDTSVTKMVCENGAVQGVVLNENEYIETKAVITNSDVAAVATGLFGPEVQSAVPFMHKNERSLSAMTWSAHVKSSGFPLAHHNVFFSRDYEGEFQTLFRGKSIPRDPTVYICAQDRNDDGNSLESSTVKDEPERMLILINAPANGDENDYTQEKVEANAQNTFSLLNRCGLELDRDPERRKVTTPSDFNHLFPATGGALYGRTSHGWSSSFKRPAARTHIKGLYLAGGSAHPGPGIPMATLSGRLAAEQLMSDMVGKIPVRRSHGSTLEAAQ